MCYQICHQPQTLLNSSGLYALQSGIRPGQVPWMNVATGPSSQAPIRCCAGQQVEAGAPDRPRQRPRPQPEPSRRLREALEAAPTQALQTPQQIQAPLQPQTQPQPQPGAVSQPGAAVAPQCIAVPAGTQPLPAVAIVQPLQGIPPAPLQRQPRPVSRCAAAPPPPLPISNRAVTLGQLSQPPPPQQRGPLRRPQRELLRPVQRCAARSERERQPRTSCQPQPRIRWQSKSRARRPCRQPQARRGARPQLQPQPQRAGQQREKQQARGGAVTPGRGRRQRWQRCIWDGKPNMMPMVAAMEIRIPSEMPSFMPLGDAADAASQACREGEEIVLNMCVLPARCDGAAYLMNFSEFM